MFISMLRQLWMLVLDWQLNLQHYYAKFQPVAHCRVLGRESVAKTFIPLVFIIKSTCSRVFLNGITFCIPEMNYARAKGTVAIIRSLSSLLPAYWISRRSNGVRSHTNKCIVIIFAATIDAVSCEYKLTWEVWKLLLLYNADLIMFLFKL